MSEQSTLRRIAAQTLARTGAVAVLRRAAHGADSLLKRFKLAEETQRGAVVIMFHRLVERPHPFRPGYDLDEFRWICRELAAHYTVLPLAQLERLRRSGRLPAGAVAITFDDGYACNLKLGLPILRSLNLPATIFVTTSAVGGDAPLWTSRVSWILEHARCDSDARASEVFGRQIKLHSLQQRIESLNWLTERLKRVDSDQREATISRLGAELGVESFGGLADEMLTWQQVRELESQGISIGAHTLTHPILSRCSDAEVEREILGGKEELESQLGHPVTTFAYPNGTPADYDARAVKAIQRGGFSAAYTTVYGANTARTPAHQQRRITLYMPTRALTCIQLERAFYATAEA